MFWSCNQQDSFTNMIAENPKPKGGDFNSLRKAHYIHILCLSTLNLTNPRNVSHI